VSLLFGLVLLGAIYSIGSALYGRQVGLAAALLLALSRFFFYSGHQARYDIMTAAWGFLAVALCLRNRSGRLWISIASGVCVSLAFETHPHGAVFVPVILVLYFLQFRWAMFRLLHFWGYALGVGLGAVAYILLHVARYPESFIAFNDVIYGITHTPPILTLNPQILIQSISDFAFAGAALYNVLAVPLVLAVILIAKRRSPADRVLLALTAALVAGFVLLIRNKGGYYFILLTPAFDLMLGVLLIESQRQLSQRRLSAYLSWIMIVGILVGGLLLNQREVIDDHYQVYRLAQSYVDQAVEPLDSVMGSQIYWFGLYDHEYYSWEALVYYQRLFSGSTLTDALEAFRPDILVIDAQISRFVSDVPGETLYEQHLRLPRRELEAFLRGRASLIAEHDVAIYGPIRVYRIDWSSVETPVQSFVSHRNGFTSCAP
jgi:hypothetical protein